MKSHELLEAVGGIDESFVQECLEEEKEKNLPEKKKNNWLKWGLAGAALLTAAAVVILIFWRKELTEEEILRLPVSPSEGCFVYDTGDAREAVGYADYVFTGKLVSYDGVHYDQTIPLSEYTVQVLENIKGSLVTSRPIHVVKDGGVMKDHKSVSIWSGDSLPESGKTYIFLGSAGPDGTIMISGPNSNVEITGNDPKIEEYKDAYKNEVVYERERYRAADDDPNKTDTSENLTSEMQAEDDPQSGIQIPAITLTEQEAAGIADMVQLVVWQGDIYTYAGNCSDDGIISTLMGDYLGEATGSIDEWSGPSDYEQNLAGTISGKIYTVKGYDPSFRLCNVSDRKDEYGKVHKELIFLDHMNGITISKGSDYFEDRLKISDRVKEITWQNRSDGDQAGTGQQPGNIHSIDLDVNGALWRNFLSEIDQAAFLEISTDAEFEASLYDESVQTHLYITLIDGTFTELRLYKGGYVGCFALGNYFVKIPGTTFDEMYKECGGK